MRSSATWALYGVCSLYMCSHNLNYCQDDILFIKKSGVVEVEEGIEGKMVVEKIK